MAFVLPEFFDSRVNNLVRCLDQYEIATSENEKNKLQSEAVATACALLKSVNLNSLMQVLTELLEAQQGENRKRAKDILGDERLFKTLLTVEDRLMQTAGLSLASRDRIRKLLVSVRAETVENEGRLNVKNIIDDFSELGRLTCEAKEMLIQENKKAEQTRARSSWHTRLVNVLGTVTILVDAGAVLASASTVVFAGLAPAAACAASAVLGGVAQSKKPKQG